MILLAVLCALLYILGGMLAYSMCKMHVEAERDGKRSSFRDPAAVIVTVILWPSLAFSMLFEQDNDSTT